MTGLAADVAAAARSHAGRTARAPGPCKFGSEQTP
jgi:hypothetical protein